MKIQDINKTIYILY